MLRKMTVCGMVALSLVFATRVNSLFGEDGLSSPQPKTSGPNGPPLTQQIHEALKELEKHGEFLKELEKRREMHNGFNPFSLNLKEESERLSRRFGLEAQLRRSIERKCPLCGGNHSSDEKCPLLRDYAAGLNPPSWPSYMGTGPTPTPYPGSLNPPSWPSYRFSTYRPEASKERSSSKAYYGLAGAGAAAAAGGLFGRRKEKQ
jgi:hypothetical protein